MKLKFFLALFFGFVFLGNLTYSQSNQKSIAPELTLNLPIGLASQVYNLGYGLHIQDQFPLGKSNFDFLLRSGVDIFPGKTLNAGIYTINVATGVAIPFLLGGRYYVANGFHLDLESGVFIGVSGGASTVFDFAPAIGYSFGGFDPLVRFNTRFQSGTSSFSFGARYQFKL